VNISTDAALERYATQLGDKSFIVFPEYREAPIKWLDSIPEQRIKDVLSQSDFMLKASPGEYYVYQLGVCALKKDIEDVQIRFSDLKGRGGKEISAMRMTCFNKGGIDYLGNPFTRKVGIEVGKVQALWLGIDLEGVKKGN